MGWGVMLAFGHRHFETERHEPIHSPEPERRSHRCGHELAMTAHPGEYAIVASLISDFEPGIIQGSARAVVLTVLRHSFIPG
jgi:hypothetical protein